MLGMEGMDSTHSNVNLTRTVPCSSLVYRHQHVTIGGRTRVSHTLSVGVILNSLILLYILNYSAGLVLRELGSVAVKLEEVAMFVLNFHGR